MTIDATYRVKPYAQFPFGAAAALADFRAVPPDSVVIVEVR